MSEDVEPQATRALVIRKAEQVFPHEELSEVLAVLDDYGSETYHQERERVQLAVLRLSGGDMAQLRKGMETARGDYRDVLCVAEYLRECELTGSADLESEATLMAREADRRDYLAWLEGDGSGPPLPKIDKKKREEEWHNILAWLEGITSLPD